MVQVSKPEGMGRHRCDNLLTWPTRAPGPPHGAFTRGPTTVTAKIQTHVMVSDGQRVWVFEFAQSDNNVLRQQNLIWLPQLLLA